MFDGFNISIWNLQGVWYAFVELDSVERSLWHHDLDALLEEVKEAVGEMQKRGGDVKQTHD